MIVRKIQGSFSRFSLFSLVVTGLLSVCFSSDSSELYAATVRGHVLDGATKESLIGAVVFNSDDKTQHDVAGLDGSYAIKNLAPGNYTLVVQYIGYIKNEQAVTIKDADENISLEFMMMVNTVSLKEALVVAKQDKESDSYARDLERNSSNTINILSAKTILLLPDLTVGSILQRVSGVTVEKTASGEGRFATIRGMDKRYNYTTINGVKVPSPDNENRYVPMDIFPSDILERLEVIKSLTPNMEGDAIGGVMNLVLKDAPDHFIVSANASTGFNQTLLDRSFVQYNASSANLQSPDQIHGYNYNASPSDFPLGIFDYKNINAPPSLIAGFTVGDRFLNNKLGVLVSGSFQDIFSGSSAFVVTPDRQPNNSPPNNPSFDDIEVRSYSMEQKRAAIQAKLDYEFNSKHKITFYTLGTEQQEIRERQYSDTSVTAPIGEIEQHYESKITDQSIYNATLKGSDSLIRNLSFDWTMAYSEAWGNLPDWSDYSQIERSPTDLIWNKMTSRWLSNTDEDFSGYGNLTYRLKLNNEKYNKLFGANGIELKAGAMNRDKNRTNVYNEYDFSTSTTVMGNNINTAPFVLPGGSNGNPQDPNNYSFQENVNAYYGMAKFTLGDKLDLLGGVRMENTTQNYETNEPLTIPGALGGKKYSDVLPSWQIKYKLTEKQAIRASYFASITRPGYFDLVPYTQTGEYFDFKGNPFLKHTQADNYDLRYEYFPKPSEQLLVGVFYKQITDAIETNFVAGSGPSAQYLEPLNAPNVATNYGFELVYNKYFLKNFGISLNYTYTKSEVVDSVKLYYTFVNGSGVVQNTNKTVAETRPLQGQADNIANISFIYKNPKIGLDALVSIVYTGLLISQVSPLQGWDYWQMPMTRLDFSFEKKLSKKIRLSIYGKINNILNTALIDRMMEPDRYTNSAAALYIPGQTTTYSFAEQKTYNTSNSILVEKELYGQSYLLGIRYKF